MNLERQVFQTDSRWRWITAKWSVRLVIISLLLIAPVIAITIATGIKPNLPLLSSEIHDNQKLQAPAIPAGLSRKELKKYHGYIDYLADHIKSTGSGRNIAVANSNRIRAAFYVDWDPQSFYSLEKNIDKLNMVIPEWLFIDPDSDTIIARIDTNALAVMKKSGVAVIPLLNNINESKGEGDFDGSITHAILHNPGKTDRLIREIVQVLEDYKLQGVNIDFEELNEKSDQPMVVFQKKLYKALHAKGLLVTQDIMPANNDFDVRSLAICNDFLFLMDYDEHYSQSIPGAISSQQWIEKNLDELADQIPSNKIILCLAAYGYDWPKGEAASTVTYQEAIANAAQFHQSISFDNHTYNNSYAYTDADKRQHEVHFNDAASNFNTIRFADQYGTGGTALWRLGSEDERIWKFYSRGLGNNEMTRHPFDFRLLERVDQTAGKPDYIGEGEVLNVISRPATGIINIEKDPVEQLIAEQKYISLPTKYVIRRYGQVHKEVVLTFDDGPDPEYTPRILDILKTAKVPAAFFVVGIQAENNLPLVKRIIREGHEIGNHTFTHPNIAAVSEQRATAEMESTRLLIESVTGRSTILFRAPYNADAEPSTEVELKPIALSKERNYYTVGESIDPTDWEKAVSADSVYDRVVRQYEANPEKGIILFHDAGGNREATVLALPRLIRYFKTKGVKFTTVAGLLHTTESVVMPPMQNHFLGLDRGIADFGFWLGRFMTTSFWVAIVLGIVRVVAMAFMAGLQKYRTGKRQTSVALPSNQPQVSIIVPAYNEEVNAVRTINSLLKQDYPSFDILFVDDGSRDNTLAIVRQAFAANERVKILNKPNGGKASALNFGISQALAEYVVCIDADTQLRENAVTMLMNSMLMVKDDELTAAVAGNVKVGNERNMLTYCQSIEYTTAQNFDRRAFDLINAITVVPGAIGAFRKSALIEAGGFTSDTLAEDCDLTIRILRKGYRVRSCPEAVAITEAPETLGQFMKQRFRWCYGIMQSFWKNREICFNPQYKWLGMIAVPNLLIFQILLPIIAPLADLMLIVSLFWAGSDPESMHKIQLFYLMFLFLDIAVSVVAFSFEGEKFTKLFWMLPQRIVYRQLMYVILYRALARAVKGEGQGWGVLKRTGNSTYPVIVFPPAS